jgi:hypothetical protein
MLKLFVNYSRQTDKQERIFAPPLYCCLHLQTYNPSINFLFFSKSITTRALHGLEASVASVAPAFKVRAPAVMSLITGKFKVGCWGVLQCHTVHAIFREYRSSVSKF